MASDTAGSPGLPPAPAPAGAGEKPPAAPVRALVATDFAAAQRANRRQTTVLLAALTAIAGGFGYLLGWTLEVHAAGGGDVLRFSPGGALGAAAMLGASALWSLGALRWGDHMVMAMAGGREIAKEEAPQLFNVVEEMCIAAGTRMPRVFLIEADAPNAFATGPDPDSGAIAVTTGLLAQLDREELQGVVAHEIGHIANLDTRYMTAVGVTVGLIALVGDMALRSLNWGGSASNRRRSGGGKSGGGGAAILILVLLAAAILAPLAAKLVQFAVSRQREYLADATAVRFTRNPAGLISALDKLDRLARPFPGVSHATQHLFIVNPLRRFTRDTPALLATHPDTEDRIERLRRLGA